MAGIFLSYRRSDTAGHAGRLHDALYQRFGVDKVFIDIGSLQPGLDFSTALDQAVASADVLIALIGPHWLNVVDAAGDRRLNNPNDYVRLEIARALARDDTRVVPVLVGKASIPRADVLPEDLKPLARLQAIELSDERWIFDVGRLIELLEPLVVRRMLPWSLSRKAAVVLAATLVAFGSGGAFAMGALESDMLNMPAPVDDIVDIMFPDSATDTPTPSDRGDDTEGGAGDNTGDGGGNDTESNTGDDTAGGAGNGGTGGAGAGVGMNGGTPTGASTDNGTPTDTPTPTETPTETPTRTDTPTEMPTDSETGHGGPTEGPAQEPTTLPQEPDPTIAPEPTTET